MVRVISRQRGGLAALKLTKLFGINDFPAANDYKLLFKDVCANCYCASLLCTKTARHVIDERARA